jgi:mannose-6-phosphate isomerase
VTTRARSPQDVDRWILPAAEGASILPAESEQYFRLERHVVDGRVVVDPGFAIIVVEDGELKLSTTAGSSRRARRGSTIAVPYDEGAIKASGSGTMLVCRPPRP